MSIHQRDKITVARIEALARKAKAEGQSLYLWDEGNGAQPGFGVRASAGDKRAQKVSFLAHRWKHGVHEQTVIGHWPTMPLDDARTEAGRRLNSPEPLGALKDKERLEAIAKREAVSLQGAVERYLAEAPLEKKRKPRPGYWKQVTQTLHRELVNKLGADTKLRDITLDDLRPLIKAKQLAEQPGAARYLFSVLSPFFNWCAGEGLFKNNGNQSPLAAYPKDKKPSAVDKRKHVLSADEIRKLWEATAGDEFWNRYFRLLLLTAQRREEVAGMRRSEIKNGNEWHIPKERTKNSEDHIVHLSPLAVAEVARCKSEGDYLFPSTPMVDKHGNAIPVKKESISGYGKAKARLDKAMGEGVRPWRVHDLRRTAASHMQELGIQPQVIEKVLNHKLEGILAVYQHAPLLPQRKAAIEAWANEVDRIATEKAAANNVIHMHGVGAA